MNSRLIRSPRPRDSQNGFYGNFWLEIRCHSGLMPANLIILADFSVSAAMSLPKSAGEPGDTDEPKAAIRALILASARPALISLLSFSTISAGVAFGAPMPVQPLSS